ncbi:MAG: hypothetical protein AB7S26_13230 [Sandaracinaceae bacterium]
MLSDAPEVSVVDVGTAVHRPAIAAFRTDATSARMFLAWQSACDDSSVHGAWVELDVASASFRAGTTSALFDEATWPACARRARCSRSATRSTERR